MFNRILNIFMEGNLRTIEERRGLETIASLLTESGYAVYKIGGFSGPDSIHVPTVADSFLRDLVESCKTAGGDKLQCNIWWKPASQMG